MKNLIILACLLLFSITIYAQDAEVTEEETNPETEVVEVVEEETSSDTVAVEEAIVDETDVTEDETTGEAVVVEEVIEEDITPQEEVLSEEVTEEEASIETSEPVNVIDKATSAEIKNRFRNIKTLKSTQEEEVKINIRKPDDSSIMPRKETDFVYLQKRDMEGKLKKSNRILY